MEAVPRLHMLWFALKTSPEGTSFANLKKYIAECYQEDPDAYSKDVYALETLRNTAMRPEKDMNGCAVLKRYYCQLHSLSNRFPQISDRNLFTFTWKDLYVSNVTEATFVRYEMAAVLFNIAALHTQVGASVSRSDIDGMKLACTHFQCAAWTFGELKEKFAGINSGADFMTPELLVFMQQVSFAQAQECILEKSLIDNRKPNIVAKVTAQIVNYYSSALVALMTGGDDGSISQVVDSSVFKLWTKYVKFKISYLNCILFLYQGQHYEEQQKMGERVALYEAAWQKLEEAKKESKGLPDQKEIAESLIFTADVVEGKRNNAKKENEFIYHEAIPELTDIAAIQGANLVNGISFSITDPEIAGEDIFGRLVPMKAHEASSLYSEEKAQLLREYGTKIEERDAELATYMSSLNLDSLNVSEEKANKIPQGIVDRCASLNAKNNAIPDLISSMSNLAEIYSDVELNLKEIKEIIGEEDQKEKLYQQNSGVHRSNAHLTELAREFQKYYEAHSKAGESNDTLRRAMELHVNNLKILSRPLQEIQSSVPKLSGDVDESMFKDLKLILNKVNEMKAQRAKFHTDLRIAVSDDDITAKVIANGDEEGLKELFLKEIAKHGKICKLIDQNIIAQSNILSALTESYAKCAPILKTLTDVKHKKESFYSSLAASYDVYEDLMGKSAKGLEFYKKLQGNVQKLLTRVRAARDVQEEDRQQRIKSTSASATKIVTKPSVSKANSSSTPKLKDYLKNSTAKSIAEASPYIPSVRPNPLGSENPSVSSAPAYPNEPPPPYTPGNQYYDATTGYTNPMYHANQPSGYYTPNPSGGGVQNVTTQMDNMSMENYYNYSQETPPAYTLYPANSSATVPGYPNQTHSQQPTQSSSNTQVYSNYSAQQPTEQSLQQQQAPLYYTGSTDPQYTTQPAYQNPQTSTYSQYQQQPINNYPQTTQSVAVGSVQQYQVSAPQFSKPTDPVYQPQPTTTIQEQPSAQHYQGGMQQYGEQNYQQTYPNQTDYQNVATTYSTPYPAQSQQRTETIDTSQHSSYSSHPGYNFNASTGNYEYASGYQVDAANLYSQYTNAMGINQQTGNTTNSSQPVNLNQYSQSNDVQQGNYYTMPYGYQSSTTPGVEVPPPTSVVVPPKATTPNPSGMTYIQSGKIHDTQTTTSGSYANSSAAGSKPTNLTKPKPPAKVTSNIDLLSDIDFSDAGAVLPAPTLTPQLAPAKLEPEPLKPTTPVPETSTNTIPSPARNPTTMPDRKSSCDNLSICSDLSSIDQNFDWDSVSVRSESAKAPETQQEVSSKTTNPFDDPKMVKYFHKEVERYEKSTENLNIKMLNGKTPLMNKWQELQDALSKDASKRTTAISKLFPEKNRSTDCVPYDHARVVLERSTDDYINAAFVKNLGPGCPTFILAQTPQQNTVTDFWSMIWSHKARAVVCLHTPNEILDTFWPQECNKETTYDDFSVTLIKQIDLSHCIELHLKVSMIGADAILNLSLLQIKAWNKSSSNHIVAIAQNILGAYKHRCEEFKSTAALVMNCLTGSERSGLLAIAICAMQATQTKRPVLINVVDVWGRICAERKNALRDMTNLELSMKIVLAHAHDVLNKRGIMTSYQMKTAQVAAVQQKEEVKDPFTDLDPLWQLKQK